MWRNLALASLTGLVSFGVYVYLHLGLNREVAIHEAEAGPLYLLFKEYRGAYHQIGPVISDVELWAAKNNVTCPRTFGRYLDDPETLDQDRLRSEGGCILNSPPTIEIPKDFLFREVAPKTYVIARFEGSPAAGPLTVYPAVRDFVNEKRIKIASPVFEIYTVNGSSVTTEYLFEKL